MNPSDNLNDVKSVAAFMAFVVDQMGHHGFGGDMAKEDFRGMAQILTWVRDEIASIEEDVERRLKEMECDTLKNVGIPLEALNDDHARRTWSAGFSHGVAHAAKGA
jgi:hypothetical protein